MSNAMKRTQALGLAAMLACLSLSTGAAETKTGTARAPALIPAPAKMQTLAGVFVLDADTPLHAQGDAAARVAGQFAQRIRDRLGASPRIDSDGKHTHGIFFSLAADARDIPDEGYRLHVGADRIDVTAREERGLFHGAITLWQLATLDDASPVRIPAVRIEDAPRFPWRGFMLDSARHFQSVDEIKQLLDAMALHKLNTFHWHLTDDQGWRIEIKQYPRLAEVGGCRVPAGDAGRDAHGRPRQYCGHYTQAQIREVVEHAARLHINVVPEVDVPGHAQAAIAAYPELGVLDARPEVSNQWGVHPYLFNNEERTLRFLEQVLDEVIELFPGRYVHLGGDEAVKDQWENSPRVQARMRELGVADEAAMQSYMLKRLEKYLEDRGRRLIGWDEIIEGGLPPEATVMSWRGTEGGLEAARQGHDVIMTPKSHLYFDYLQTASPDEPPGRPAQVTLEQVYAFEPVHEALPAALRHHILGLQANLWTEHTRRFARVQHHLFPRLAALAEVGWSPASRRDLPDFLARLPTQMARYRSIGIAAAPTPFSVLMDIEDVGGARVRLQNPLGYSVHYTRDGSAPHAQSPRYQDPLGVSLPATIRAAAFADGRAVGPVVTRRFTHEDLRRRTDDQLATCPDAGRLLLRLEDDGPVDGERALFNVAIFNPCWRWTDADLSGISRVIVRAGRIPYFFQLAHDEPKRRFEPATDGRRELRVRTGDCTGEPIARVALPQAPDADGFTTLDVVLPTGMRGRQDLCINFTGDTRPDMWVLDEVRLSP